MVLLALFAFDFQCLSSDISGSFTKMPRPGKAPKITPNIIDLGASGGRDRGAGRVGSGG